ncbi:hypothetical protein [Nocardioides sp. TF02-7]|uniref:hypothetical protein n=1 Tax=Nocardioides sp. TF02-7 TaxID=2917724 RepID=UPI001F068306|nr:hypothetical protein [Nocardioides sp. TF02-7]UMG91831.1 hypothetical protein MF408_17545 [Nocardioides sp. TF02-7]
MTAQMEELVGPPTLPGVTRFDVLCRPGVVETVLGLVDRWASDRALSEGSVTRLESLMRVTLAHGLRFGPRRLTLLIRWQDLERVRVDVRWSGCSDAAAADQGGHDLQATIATLDALAADWGVARDDGGWLQWIVADTE